MPTRIKLLYIEDDLDHANVIIKRLSKSTCSDFAVEHRGDLQSSLEYLTSVDCDVDAVLLDLMLPNSRGVDTFKRVHEHCITVPVIIMSDHEAIAIECIKLGAQDYLIKPDIPFKLLCRSIEYAIERRKLQNRYKELLDVTKAVIYEIDFLTGRFTYVNDAMVKLTGYSKDELRVMQADNLLTQSSRNRFMERMQQLVMGEFIDHTEEYELRLKDGTIKWTLITAKYKEDRDKNVTGANVVAIDITDKKLAEAEAKRKEELIFNELEIRIQQWKSEIVSNTQISQRQLQAISNDIMSMEKTEAV